MPTINNQISIEDFKKLTSNIIKKEEEKYNIKLNISILTIGQYYQNDTFKKKLTLEKIPGKLILLTLPLKSKGANLTYPDQIFIFYNKNNLWIDTLPNIIKCILHEIRHTIQRDYKYFYTNFEQFIFNIEKIIQLKNPNFYNINYIKYYCEIEANYYAILETEKILTEYHLDFQEYIDYYKKIYEYKLKTYDIDFFFEEFNNILKQHNLSNFIKNTYFHIFYNENGDFKPLNKILAKLKDTNLDYNIISTIICSKSFLKTVNTNKLTNQELTFLITILNDKYNDIKEIKQLNNNYKPFNNSNSQLLSIKLNYLNLKIEEYLERKKALNYKLKKYLIKKDKYKRQSI